MLPSFSSISRARIALIGALLALIFVAGCAKKTKRTHLPATPHIGSVETGIASWYGVPYHGRRAANGEIYDMEKLTAAHRTLPFSTWVQVENLDNGKLVTVRITDRGPFVGDRIIDLSKAAAREIGMLGPGLARVRLKIVVAPPVIATTTAPVSVPAAPSPVPAPPPVITQSATAPATPPATPPAITPPVTQPMYAVQIGAFQDRVRAESLTRRYEVQYGKARMVARAGNPTLWRVLVGAVPTIDEANELRSHIESAGQEAFVVMLDDAPVTNGHR